MKTLTTAATVFDVLGGTKEVAALTDANIKAVRNWYAFNAFPADTYVLMIEQLKLREFTAPPSLWHMRGFGKRKRRKRAA
jgi:hypothetical protein